MSLCQKINILNWLFCRNEDVADASLLTCNGIRIEDSDKQDIVTNIECEALVNSIKKFFFISAWFLLQIN